MNFRLATFVALLAFPLHAAPELVPDTVAGAGREAVRAPAQQLLRARDLADRGKDAEALDAYVRLLETSGDQLLPWFLVSRPLKEVLELLGKEGGAQSLVPLDERHLVPARWLCHRCIAALPEKTLAVYRERIDETAKTRLDDAIRRRDRGQLQRIVEESFASRPAEAALVLLGDLALADGEPALALRWWQLVVAPASAGDGAAISGGPGFYPDPKGDIAAVRARQILAMLRMGERDAAKTALNGLRKHHAAATGRLAGQDGKFVDILGKLADEQTPRDTIQLGDPWTSFAGNPSRNHVVSESLPVYWPAQPDFRENLPSEPAKSTILDDIPAPASIASRWLAFHPVVWRGYLLVADAVQVRAIDRKTGRAWTVYDMDPRPTGIDRKLPARLGVRYTLTVADDRVYVRMGAQTLRAVAGAPANALDTLIVCLGPPAKPRPDGSPLERYWELFPDRKDEKLPSVFEGTPVVRGDRLYVGVTRFDGRGIVTSVACFGPLVGREPPDPVWRKPTEVCVITAGTADEARTRHDLLTLAGPNVVHTSHTGSIVAVDATSGQRAWAHLYPHRAPGLIEGRPTPRDLSPAVYANGRLFVGPADLDRIICLDAWTGARLWEVNGVEPVQLLGVTRGRLVATLAAFPAGIRAWDAATGAVRWSQPDDGPNGLATFGRGFLTETHVFWPTARGLHVLSAEDGALVQRLNHERWGNLVYANGTLAAAGERQIVWFNREAVSLPERRAAIEQRPDNPRERYRLALAEADAGLTEQAATRFAQVVGDDTLEGRPIRELAQRRRWELLRDQRSPAASLGTFPASWQAASLAGTPEGWQAILLTDRLRDAWLTGPDGRPQRAEALARAALRLPMGPTDSLEVCRRTLRSATGADQASALAESAKFLEKLGHAGPARSAWRKAARAGYDKSSVNRHLERLKPAEKFVGVDVGDPREPLEKVADVPLAPFSESLLDVIFSDEPFPTDFLLFGRGEEVVSRRGDTGAVAWRVQLPFTPASVAAHADLFVVCGSGGVAAIEATSGKMVWWFVPPSPEPRFRRLTPSETPLLSHFSLSDGRLFAVQDGQRLLALDADAGTVLWQRDSPPFAEPFDGLSLNPHYLATPDFVLVQIAPGRRWILDAFTGAILHTADTPKTPWNTPPVAFDARQAVVSEPDAVALVDLGTGRTLWRYPLERWTGLLHDPPAAVVAGNRIVFAVGRSHGHELEAVDALTGRQSWPESAFLGRHRPDLSAAAVTRDLIVLPSGGQLLAIRLADGRRLWSRPLPTGDWRCETTRAGDFLLLTPSTATPSRDFAAMRRWAFGQMQGIPTPNRVSRVAEGLWDAWLDQRATWFVVDLRDGRDVRRSELPVEGAAVDFRAGGGRLWLAHSAGLVLFRAGR